MLGFDWDDANREHIARHGVSFEEAEEAFSSTTLELGYQVLDGEERLEEVGNLLTLQRRYGWNITDERVFAMSEMQELPKFASEAEEAQWWYDRREERAEAFVNASREGRVTQGAMMRRGLVRTPTVLISHEDNAVAKMLAEKKGVPHETYIQTLVHEALQREKQLADHL